MNRWLARYFKKEGRPKCLVLIGPTGTGKQSIIKIDMSPQSNDFTFNNII